MGAKIDTRDIRYLGELKCHNCIGGMQILDSWFAPFWVLETDVAING
jgi:hypothetical protein